MLPVCRRSDAQGFTSGAVVVAGLPEGAERREQHEEEEHAVQKHRQGPEAPAQAPLAQVHNEQLRRK